MLKGQASTSNTTPLAWHGACNRRGYIHIHKGTSSGPKAERRAVYIECFPACLMMFPECDCDALREHPTLNLSFLKHGCQNERRKKRIHGADSRSMLAGIQDASKMRGAAHGQQCDERCKLILGLIDSNWRRASAARAREHPPGAPERL